MLKQKYFLTDFFILSAEKQPIKLSWRNIEWLLTIAHIGSYQTPEPEAGVSNVTVECPLLYVLGLNTNTFRAVAPHTHCVHLRAPPAYC